MSKLFIALFIVAASFSLAKGDILSDLINTDKAELSGLEIIRILLNPDQPIQDKIGQIFLEKAMKTLAKQGESIDLKLGDVSNTDIGQIFTMEAELSDSQQKSTKCQITLLIHFVTKLSDVTISCDGMPTIVKQIPWDQKN